MTSILVVDDSAVDRRLVGGLVQKVLPCDVNYAANGVEALAQMHGDLPDLILTDLNMPVMDGLELVNYVRDHHPEVPIVLMTAYGSEALAVEALAKGAATYVPKSQLAAKLPSTIQNVLSMTFVHRSYEQLIHCLSRAEFAFVLQSEPSLVDPLVDLVQQMVASVVLCDFTGRLQIGVALKEALLNAIFHGNLEISPSEIQNVQHGLIEENDQSLVEEHRMRPEYKDRKVHVEIRITSDEARFVVRDDGKGFDVATVFDPKKRLAVEPEGPRGLALMRTFMDEVTFNEIGNEITMVKRRDVPQANNAPPVEL
jgi:CheY-like chemotaxis protein